MNTIYDGVQSPNWYEFDKIYIGNYNDLITSATKIVSLGRYFLLCYSEKAYSSVEKNNIINGIDLSTTDKQTFKENYDIDKNNYGDKDRTIFQYAYNESKKRCEYIEIGKATFNVDVDEFVGRFTSNKGETFNNYSGNNALSLYSHAEGTLTTAGGTAFKIISVTKGNDEIILGIDDNTDIKQLKVNMKCSYYFSGYATSEQTNGNYDYYGKITGINLNNNTITVKGFPDDVVFDEGKENLLWIPSSASSNYTNIGGTIEIGQFSHAEGHETKAAQVASHAEGSKTAANGKYAHAEGYQTEAAYAAHSEGWVTKALGRGSHSEGRNTEAQKDYSHAGGLGTKATTEAQSVIGKYNSVDNDALFIVGNGDNSTVLKNAFVVKQDGRATIQTPPTENMDIANKQYVDDKLADLVGTAPETLDTLEELAKVLGDDSALATNVIEELNKKQEILIPDENEAISISEENIIKYNTKGGEGIGKIGNNNTSEIFNDYANNKAGCKGYKIINIEQGENSGTYKTYVFTLEDYETGYRSGDIFSLQMTNNYDYIGQIKEIDNNKILVWFGWLNPITNSFSPCNTNNSSINSTILNALTNIDANPKYFWVPSKPTIGNIDIGEHSHAEGCNTIASGKYAHTEGLKTQAGYAAHASGSQTLAQGNYSVAFGNKTHARGNSSASFGSQTKAYGESSIAIGQDSQTGRGTTIDGQKEGYNAFAGGKGSIAIGKNSFAYGENTYTNFANQFAIGKFNTTNSTALFVIGNGGDNDNRKDIFGVYTDGRAFVGAEPTDNMDVANKGYVDDLISELQNDCISKTEGGIIEHNLGMYTNYLTSDKIGYKDNVFHVEASLSSQHETEKILLPDYAELISVDKFSGILELTGQEDYPYETKAYKFIITAMGVEGNNTAKKSWQSWLEINNLKQRIEKLENSTT